MLLFAGIIIYFAFIIGVGLWYAKRSSSSPKEYFLGGRTLGPIVTAMSAEASDMSGWLLMGLPGVAYFTGIAEAFWTAVGLALGTAVNWIIVSRRLRVYSQAASDSFTLPTFFSNRFHDKRGILAVIAALLILVFFSIYVGAQFVTFGKLFTFVFGNAEYYKTMVIVGGIVVLAYTLLGGFLAESTTDTVQGFLMITVIVLVLTFGVSAAGGISHVIANLSAFPRFLDIFGMALPTDASGELTPLFSEGKDYGILNIVSCLAWGLGYFGMPQVLLRFMAISHPDKLKQTRVIAISWCFLSLFAAVALGLVGRSFVPELFTTGGDAENIFLYMTMQFFPPVLAGLLISGVLAASMSSSDSYMLIVSSSFANDLVKGIFKRDLSEKNVMHWARGTMVAVTIFGIFVATSGNDSIFRIVSYAWAGLGASFGPLILFSLFFRRTTLAGAISGMVTGGATVIIWKQLPFLLGGAVDLPAFFSVYELLPAFLLSCLVILIVSLCTKSNAEIEREFDAAFAK